MLSYISRISADNLPIAELLETDHLVDMSKPEDLKKILALGMIAEFSGVLYRPRYESKEKFVEKIPQERMCFRILMKAFSARYATRIGNEWVHPSYIYKVSVVMFAIALIRYRSKIGEVQDGVTARQLTKAIQEHFAKDHSDLVPALNLALNNEEEEETGWLVWSGPSINITRRDTLQRDLAAAGVQERRQYSEYPIYH